eukprot:scaffold115231_cov38-Tisochrysis_lutea.AAC.1
MQTDDDGWADVVRPWAPAAQLRQERAALLGTDQTAVQRNEEAKLQLRVEQMSKGMADLLARVEQMDAAAPVLPAVPEEGPAGSWLTDETGAGYGPPTTTEILPDFLLSEEAVKFVESNPELYISWSTRSMFKWAIGLTISRRLSDMALKHVTGFNSSTQALPFEATWDEGPQPDTSNAPHLTWVPWIGASRSNIQMPWLGCRCSWPCTQLCWWNCIACGCYQHVAIIWCIITLYFEFILLDAMVVQDFIAKVPDRITSWDDYATLQV